MSTPILSTPSTRVKSDHDAGLVTVACPKCGITAGILPTSTAWHGNCEARMVPVDPDVAAKLRKRREMRRYMRRHRLAGGTLQPPNIPAQNRATAGLQQASEASGGS